MNHKNFKIMEIWSYMAFDKPSVIHRDLSYMVQLSPCHMYLTWSQFNTGNHLTTAMPFLNCPSHTCSVSATVHPAANTDEL